MQLLKTKKSLWRSAWQTCWLMDWPAYRPADNSPLNCWDQEPHLVWYPAESAFSVSVDCWVSRHSAIINQIGADFGPYMAARFGLFLRGFGHMDRNQSCVFLACQSLCLPNWSCGRAKTFLHIWRTCGQALQGWEKLYFPLSPGVQGSDVLCADFCWFK